MQQIIAYVVACWLLVVIFITSATANNIAFLKRNEKRNINLLGKEAVNHIYTDELGCVRVNEADCVKCISKLPCANNVVGMIFVYDKFIIGVNRNGDIIDRFDYVDISEVNKVSYINRMANKILIGRENAVKIEIDCGGDNFFFNSLDKGIEVFLISGNESYLAVSGYMII